MSAVQPQTPNYLPVGKKKKDRRRNRRIGIRLNGRFLNEISEDHGLVTRNISCSGALIDSNYRPPTGARVVCYFDHLGRVSASVTRRTENGFAVSFQTTQHKRDKLADKLIWLINRGPLKLVDERVAPRYAAGGPAMVQRADGRDIQCRVVDISLSGASFRTDGPPPMVGEVVKAGNLKGTVVRCEEDMFAIRYLTKLDEAER